MLETPTTGIARLLSEKNAFVVPHHQRNYSWTEDEIETLFRDLGHAMDEEEPEYFLGLMVFIPKTETEFTILDGQQRLVTTAIILSAVRSWLRARDYATDADQIQGQFIASRELGGSEFTPRLVLNEQNNPTYRDFVVREAPNEEIQKALKKEDRYSANKQLLEAVLTCREKIAEVAQAANSTEESAKKLFAIVNYFERSVKVVRLHVPSESNAYTVFETLNDRGLDLSVLDLVKNHIFGKASTKTLLREVQSRWVQMMGNLTNSRGDDFLKVWWTSRFGRVQTPQLFTLFKSKVQSREDSDSVSRDLLAASDHYSILEIADDPIWAGYSVRARRSIKALKLIGAKQSHPILLSALSHFEQAEMEKLLWYLEVLFVRYQLIGGGRTGRLEIACAKVAESIWSKKMASMGAVTAALRELYPSDGDFKLAFKAKQERGSPKARYLLTCLETQALRKKDGGGIGQELEVSNSLTLEHILPKSPSEAWVSAAQADEFFFEECVHRIGNLCLLTNVNRSLGAEGFSTKKQTYSQSGLLTTSMIHGYESWNRETIENRQEYLAGLAAEYWRAS